MRIFYINHYAGSPRHGMEYRPHYLARHWVRLGHEAVIVSASHAHVRRMPPRISGDIAEETIDGVRHIWLRTPAYEGNGVRRSLNMAGFVLALYRLRKQLLRRFRPDAVIASSTYTWDIFPARSLARACGAKLAYEVHDLWPLSPMELGGMPRWHPFILSLQWGENYACRHADTVVSMLPLAHRHLLEHGMAARKFHYIPNGIELSEWEDGNARLPHPHAELLKAWRGQGRFIVCYAGAHGLANALGHLVMAAARLMQTRLTVALIGDGPEKAQLRELAVRQGAENVFFLDPLPKEAIPEFLRCCDAAYIGLRRQPLFRFGVSPNKLMDYMAAGKPVISAIEAGNDMVAEAGCGISVRAEDPVAIAGAIIRLMALPADERMRMGRAGKEYVGRHHDYAVLARRFLDVLHSPPRRMRLALAKSSDGEES